MIESSVQALDLEADLTTPETETGKELLPSTAVEAYVMDLKPFPDKPSIRQIIENLELGPAETAKVMQMGSWIVAATLDDVETNPLKAVELWQAPTFGDIEAVLAVNAPDIYNQLLNQLHAAAETNS